VTAATREVLQSHFGAAILQPDPEEYLRKDSRRSWKPWRSPPA